MSNEHNTPQFDFEEFNPAPRPAVNGFNVAIYRHHRELRMNRKTHEAIGSPGSVMLLYDPGRRVIGIKPIYDDAASSIQIRLLKDGHAGLMMYEFLRKYMIDLPTSIRFLDPFINESTLILELDRTAAVGHKRQSPGSDAAENVIEREPCTHPAT